MRVGDATGATGVFGVQSAARTPVTSRNGARVHIGFPSVELGLLLVLIGCGVGVVSGLLGVGGGIVMVPVLLVLLPPILGASAPTEEIVAATSLAVGSVTSLSSAVAHRRNQGMWWHAVIPLGIGGLVGAQGGALLASKLSALTLDRIFGVVLVVSSALLWIGKSGLGKGAGDEPVRQPAVLVVVGVVIGVVSGLTGLGGALLATPILVLGLRYPIHRAVGTMSLVVVFTAHLGHRRAHAHRAGRGAPAAVLHRLRQLVHRRVSGGDQRDLRAVRGEPGAQDRPAGAAPRVLRGRATDGRVHTGAVRRGRRRRACGRHVRGQGRSLCSAPALGLLNHGRDGARRAPARARAGIHSYPNDTCPCRATIGADAWGGDCKP